MLTPEIQKKLSKDENGLLTYEYIANNMAKLDDESMSELVDNIIMVDRTGQFAASTACYLKATDASRFEPVIDRLIKATIEKDRTRSYLQRLLVGIWGENYLEKVEALRATDDNFRRIYKRLYPGAAHPI